MNKMFKILIVMMLVGLVALAAQADPYLQVLGLAGRASYNATHVYRVTFDAFSESDTNTAETLSIPIPANTGVRLVACQLNTTFDTGNTNYTGSCALKVGGWCR